MRVVALVADMVFESKITATADHVGVPVRTVRTTHDALAAVAEASGLIVDMNISAGDPLQFVRDAKQQRPDVRVIAFLSHVQVELAQETREAGADEVMPKSEFTEHLPAILERLREPTHSGS